MTEILRAAWRLNLLSFAPCWRELPADIDECDGVSTWFSGASSSGVTSRPDERRATR